MRYFLKACGETNPPNPNADWLIRNSSDEVKSSFWEDTQRNWLSNNLKGFGVNIGDIFICYVVMGDPRSGGRLKGRILGYYEVVSNLINDNLENHWFWYVQTKNKCKSFSEKSKHNTVLHVKDFIDKFSGTIQSGYQILDERLAKRIIDAIEKNK